MVDKTNAIGGTVFGQQRFEAFLAFGERKGAQIFAACEQQIEDEEDQVL
jgi:hypothetical protein